MRKSNGEGTDAKAAGLAALLLLLIFGWIWNELEHLDHSKADRHEAGDRWTGSQQSEYRKTVQAEIEAIRREIKQLERRIEDLENDAKAATQ